MSRVRVAFFAAVSVTLLLVFVHACIPDPITDLRVVRVTRLSASALPRAEDLRERMIRNGESVLKISLSGDARWIREVRWHHLNSYAIIARCDRPDAELFSVGPYLGDIPVTYGGEGLRALRPASPNVRYDVYLPETGRYTSHADVNAPMPSYDLGRERLALCVRIAGGAMHGAYGRSNEVRVVVGGPA